MPLQITDLHAVEILDSRARPTLAVTLTTVDGARVRAGVPSGASTGTREAVELRDGDASRYNGQGVRTAVGHVNGEIAQALTGRSFDSAADVDRALLDLDGTDTKARLGANAVIGVSMAAMRAEAVLAGRELWQHIAQVAGTTPRLPVPHFNVVNGGAHATNNLDFQEFMLAPLGAPSLPEAVRAGAEVYAKLKAILSAQGHAVGLGDEGGFAPAVDRPEEVLQLLIDAVTATGHAAGREGIAIALDPAASEFHRDGGYDVAGEKLTSDQLIERYEAIVDRFPLWSIEDGLAEDDWGGWVRLTERLGDRVQLMGDDIFVTNPAIITEAISKKIGNSALIKVNQIGTVTETLEAMRICREAGYTQMVSHRSGETEDSFIADLVVGTGSGQIKSGAPARGERVAKYNRLIEIAEANPSLPFGLADA
ncbi:phosphopyruvate hydratase [Streptomyces pluripotens]|uniref:Enolase n=1 Tax=Streptomyces pluripotens TaxID=1355015 RepID=A0A221P178_9ACTN|nr:phosphopyruvate hydratase [Streptomyces pluripotens]ARP71767.1 phosphopyruvate hydratase [Streptomyces pluripotens]ASN26019.1 phosphopyruvate hydratase [Streptomyces pluripotens]